MKPCKFGNRCRNIATCQFDHSQQQQQHQQPFQQGGRQQQQQNFQQGGRQQQHQQQQQPFQQQQQQQPFQQQRGQQFQGGRQQHQQQQYQGGWQQPQQQQQLHGGWQQPPQQQQQLGGWQQPQQQQQPPQQQQFQKKKQICRFFNTIEGCQRQNCAFLHEIDPQQQQQQQQSIARPLFGQQQQQQPQQHYQMQQNHHQHYQQQQQQSVPKVFFPQPVVLKSALEIFPTMAPGERSGLSLLAENFRKGRLKHEAPRPRGALRPLSVPVFQLKPQDTVKLDLSKSSLRVCSESTAIVEKERRLDADARNEYSKFRSPLATWVTDIDEDVPERCPYGDKL
jgi:hypothetical protein